MDRHDAFERAVASAEERFQYVQRFRYGIDRDCVLDTLTGALAVFVTPGIAGTAARLLNDDPSRVAGYAWTNDRASHSEGPER